MTNEEAYKALDSSMRAALQLQKGKKWKEFYVNHILLRLQPATLDRAYVKEYGAMLSLNATRSTKPLMETNFKRMKPVEVVLTVQSHFLTHSAEPIRLTKKQIKELIGGSSWDSLKF